MAVFSSSQEENGPTDDPNAGIAAQSLSQQQRDADVSKYAHVFNQVCEIIANEGTELQNQLDELDLTLQETLNLQRQIVAETMSIEQSQEAVTEIQAKLDGQHQEKARVQDEIRTTQQQQETDSFAIAELQAQLAGLENEFNQIASEVEQQPLTVDEITHIQHQTNMFKAQDDTLQKELKQA